MFRLVNFWTGGNSPRYYQRIAITDVEAVQRRKANLLRVMATGAEQTMTAFQIIYRLKKAGKSGRGGYQPICILIDQTMANDFKAISKGVMTR